MIAPIVPLIVGNNGAWLAVRTSAAQGSCGTHGYPCKHPGVDVVGTAGTPVRAPDNGVVVNAGDGTGAPYVGYGPWFVIIRGDSDGKFHLLGHLDPANMMRAPVGLRVTEGAIIGTTSSANHTHWEVRKKMAPAFSAGEDNFTNNEDPVAWLSGGSIVMIAALAVGGFLLYMLARR